jgi:hypothetical protein
MTSYVLCDIAKCQYVPESCDPMSKNLKYKMMNALKKNEVKRFYDITSLNMDDDDLEFIVHQVWRGRCAATDRRIGGNSALVLTRWIPSQPPTVYNIVQLAPHLAEALTEKGVEGLPIEVVQIITQRLAWAKEAYLK